MKKCLIVDDSSVIRKVARRIMEDANFAIEEAENGQIALDACKRTLPDVVLLDWNMPVMDGLEFLTELRKDPCAQAIKVIFCTTENDMDHITQAISAGANEYIMKPFDKEIIHSKLREVGLLEA